MVKNILLILLMVLFSAFFSSSEIVYLSTNEKRLASHKDESILYKTAYALKQHFEYVLPSILIGNSLVNLVSSSLATLVMVELIGDSGSVVSTVVMTVIVLIFGEIVPKAVGKRLNETLPRFFAIPLLIVTVITVPLSFIANLLMKLVDVIHRPENNDTISEEELIAAIEVAEDEEVIDSDESELLTNTIEFPEITAEDVYTPRVDVVAIDINWSLEKIKEIALSSPFSRLPVYDGSIDDIIGAVTLNRLFRALASKNSQNIDIRAIMSSVVDVYKTTPLPRIMAELRQKRANMAIVYGEYGEFLGIVTMEDILEQIVGEIWDETDTVEPEISEISDDEYIISGDMLIEDMADSLEIEDEHIEDYDSDTIGGLAIETLGHFPEKGERFSVDEWDFTVMSVDDRRVEQVLAEKTETGDEDEED